MGSSKHTKYIASFFILKSLADGLAGLLILEFSLKVTSVTM